MQNIFKYKFMESDLVSRRLIFVFVYIFASIYIRLTFRDVFFFFYYYLVRLERT